jgi:hypothetical protein
MPFSFIETVSTSDFNGLTKFIPQRFNSFFFSPAALCHFDFPFVISTSPLSFRLPLCHFDFPSVISTEGRNLYSHAPSPSAIVIVGQAMPAILD